MNLRSLASLITAICLGMGAALAQPGAIDPSFDPGSGTNDLVYDIAAQPDGKIIIGGPFTSYNGTARNKIARLNADGSLDGGFADEVEGMHSIRTLVLQPDGKILIQGQLLNYHFHTARLNADGTLDESFSTGLAGGADAIALQADGKVLLGGGFLDFGGFVQNYITRLHSDGSLDTSFVPGLGPYGGVYDIAAQPDGKIIIGGPFTSYNGTARNRIARLNPDGSLDDSFDPGTGVDGGGVYRIVLQPDGKILIGGDFTSYNGILRDRIARLNADGSLDASFGAGTGVNLDVYAMALQSDGKVLIGGDFGNYNGTSRNGIARLNADGSLDIGFDPGTGCGGPYGGGVRCMALQSDGKALIGGQFTSYNGIERNFLARVLGGEAQQEEVVALALRTYLEGPYSPGAGLMHDSLRSHGLIPLTEPYTDLGYDHVGGGGETTISEVLTATGPNAIVDWVVVELRDKDAPANVLQSRSALVQRDGDVVGMDGVSPMNFTLPPGEYHVAIRHRNHLGAMTADALALSSAPTTVDLTLPATATYGTDARKPITGDFPTLTLWAGDVNFDGVLRYTGEDNDRDPILQAVGGVVPTNVLDGQYRNDDVNMDGAVRYTGEGNDRDRILSNIGGVVPTNTRTKQLP